MRKLAPTKSGHPLASTWSRVRLVTNEQPEPETNAHISSVEQRNVVDEPTLLMEVMSRQHFYPYQYSGEMHPLLLIRRALLQYTMIQQTDEARLPTAIRVSKENKAYLELMANKVYYGGCYHIGQFAIPVTSDEGMAMLLPDDMLVLVSPVAPEGTT